MPSPEAEAKTQKAFSILTTFTNTAAIVPVIWTTTKQIATSWTRDMSYSSFACGALASFGELVLNRHSFSPLIASAVSVGINGIANFLNGLMVRSDAWFHLSEQYCGIDNSRSNTTECINFQHNYDNNESDLLGFSTRFAITACQTTLLFHCGYHIARIAAQQFGLFSRPERINNLEHQPPAQQRAAASEEEIPLRDSRQQQQEVSNSNDDVNDSIGNRV